MKASASDSSSSSVSPVSSQANIYELLKPGSSMSKKQAKSSAGRSISKVIKDDADDNSLCGEGSSAAYDGENIQILVDSCTFIVNPEIFGRVKDSMLYRMFYGQKQMAKTNANGQYKIEGFSSTIFNAVLEFYKLGQMKCPPGVTLSELHDACDYFLIPFSHTTVKCYNLRGLLHEISNVGASNQFEAYLDDELLPVMARCARIGERECHIVVLDNEDVVDWDHEYPPQTGEEYAHVIYNRNLYRFLKYIENREVSKQVLKDRGLKKIRLGIEGYPTHMERVKKRLQGKHEVIYNYIQRPFIRMSWEKEENKSRHVDFQCLRSKSITNLSLDGGDAALDQEMVARVDLGAMNPANVQPEEAVAPPAAPVNGDQVQPGALGGDAQQQVNGYAVLGNGPEPEPVDGIFMQIDGNAPPAPHSPRPEVNGGDDEDIVAARRNNERSSAFLPGSSPRPSANDER